MTPDNATLKMPQPEQIIAGRYRIISRLGSGGMGFVFLAEQLGVGNKVALKFLDPEPNGDEARVARFLREAKIGLEVQHPNAAQILDVGRDEQNRLYLCFELVEGEDLRDILKREGRVRFGEARDIALQMAQVLVFAHGRGIIHRDVKPENVRILRDLAGPHVKMLDFGIARLLKGSGVRLTAEGMLAGTPRYMAPEQVKDDPLDGRVDQYALGLVFFEMLTGAVAMSGKNVSQILMHQIQMPVPPIAWVDPQLANPEIDAFIARACAKSPNDRFASMTDFLIALKALHVDERRWPAPRSPPGLNQNREAPTREGLVPERNEVSDTVVRRPERTEVQPRPEVPTEPNREAVARKAPAPIEAKTMPERTRSERSYDPNLVTEKPSLPPPVDTVPIVLAQYQDPKPQTDERRHLEAPTEPERPAVQRKPPLPAPGPRDSSQLRETAYGTVAPPRKRRTGLIVAVVLIIGALIAAALWRFNS